MPGVERAPTGLPGGQMDGVQGRHVVWHTSESDPDASMHGIRDWVVQQGSEYHLIWDHLRGRFLQILPADVSARALRNDGSWRTNRVGELRVQVCLVGHAADAPLRHSPLRGSDRVMGWLDSLGVPRVARPSPMRERRLWLRAGHHGHVDAPGNDHTDPGLVDGYQRLFRAGIQPPMMGDQQMVLAVMLLGWLCAVAVGSRWNAWMLRCGRNRVRGAGSGCAVELLRMSAQGWLGRVRLRAWLGLRIATGAPLCGIPSLVWSTACSGCPPSPKLWMTAGGCPCGTAA